ncbi:DUF1697 domain-containing protein [Algibacter sp. R77976]|uniref:DUF1697 domain-containing protein n=1 Tax=Algibacter sp. R77976 TaxID=3093873 RepID=UPI0037CC5058
MNTYIAFLRGINVGGHKKVPMAELRALLSKIGLEKVQTYIQSGNVIFQSKETDVKTLQAEIEKALFKHFEFEVPVLVITPQYLKQIFDDCPFSEDQKVNSYFMFLYSVPDKDLVKEVTEQSYPNETFAVTDPSVYFYSSVGYGKAKCSNSFFERKLKVTATARNYKTMVKLISLSLTN